MSTLELTKEVPSTFDEVVSEMLKCEQVEGISVYKHGQMVLNNINLIKSYVQGDLPLDDWKIPDWLKEYGFFHIRKYA